MRQGGGVDPGYLAAILVLALGAAWALSVDVVEAGYGVKGDEATYVSMALSAAYDGDLVYERRDLERFSQIYGGGPEGIFLKLGQHNRLSLVGRWPFLSIESRPASGARRLYFGKAYIHAVLAAPFVRLAGLNGLLLFHVLLLACLVGVAYRFLAAQSPPAGALLFALAFFGVSVVPLYAVWLSPELLNVTLVFVAYFLWFYREVAEPADSGTGRLVRGRSADILAAVLLGMAAFSKPTNVLLILPPLVWRWWQRRVRAGLLVGVVFASVVAGLFAVNGLISGDPNYQGGERRTYYGSYPFEADGVGFADRGISVSTNALTVDEPLDERGTGVLVRNAWYFMVGRHFGFVPYFFPGFVTGLIALGRWRRLRVWQWSILGAAAATAIALLIYLPYSWSGGGGPTGNRYFLSVYPVLLFLAPPIESVAPALIAWCGGALFTAQILVSPFASAKRPYVAPQHGPLRWLPVELTMVNDLPIRLDASRSRIPLGQDPTLFLYLLDRHAWPPEAPGVWIEGRSRAEIIVRTDQRLASLDVRLEAPVANRVRLAAGRATRTVSLEPGRPETVRVEVHGVYSRESWAYLLSVETDAGFVPRLDFPPSDDARFLGVAVTPVGRPAPGGAGRP